MDQYSNQTSKILYVKFNFMKEICVKKWKLVFLQHNAFTTYVFSFPQEN